MKKIFMAAFILIFLGVTMQSSVSAETLQDNLVPQDQQQKSVGEVDLLYNEYPAYQYKLDTYVDTSGDWMPWNWAEGAGKQVYIALMEIVNTIWALNLTFSSFAMVLVQEAFQLDFVSGVVDEIGLAVQQIAGFGQDGFLSNGVWPILVTFMLCLVGSWATYVGMVKRESSRAWSGLLSALLIFVLSLGFFANAGKVLGGINSWSSEIQSDILAVSASIVNPGSSYTKDEGIATIRNQMFDLMIKKPYLLMEYGTTAVKKERVDKILLLNPISDGEERQELVKKEVEDEQNSMMSIDGITQRAAFVPLLFLGNLIIGLFMLLISGSIILFQLIFLVLALFAPVPLLMAIVPKWQQTAVDWAMKLIHAQLMKIAIALLLTILFSISAILYRSTEESDLGYLGMMVLQIICFVGIWAKRKDLFGMVSTATNHIQSHTGQTLQRYKQRYSQARQAVRKGRSTPNHRQNGHGDEPPLANRHLGFLNKQQRQERRTQNREAYKKLKDAAENIILLSRRNQTEDEIKDESGNLSSQRGTVNRRKKIKLTKRSLPAKSERPNRTTNEREQKGRNELLTETKQGSREIATGLEPIYKGSLPPLQRHHKPPKKIRLQRPTSSGRTPKLEGEGSQRNVETETTIRAEKRHPKVDSQSRQSSVELVERVTIKAPPPKENGPRTPDKHLTRWEAQQQINRRNEKKEE